jgi:hypothetical protein
MEFTEQAMASRLKWERATLASKEKLSVRDEREFMDRDLASRWLERQEQWQQRRRKWRKSVQSGNGIESKRSVKGTPPWEGASEFDQSAKRRKTFVMDAANVARRARQGRHVRAWKKKRGIPRH